MKEILLFLLFFWAMPLISKAQLSLTIEISGLRNNNGHIHFELSNDSENRVAGLTRAISGNTCTIIVENLKPGKYAFKFFHDENQNNKLDGNWLGIPKEGFGFSNDPAMTFGPPAFGKTVFELNGARVMRCKPKYF
jgi:uncharacterized protein (DUF2141 family)